MNAEVFRFVSIRPPQPAAGSGSVNDGGKNSSVDVVDLGVSQSPFIDALRQTRNAGSRADMVDVGAKFVSSGAFLDSPEKLGASVANLVSALHGLADPDWWNAAGQTATTILGTPPSAFVVGDAYAKLVAQAVDSIVAAAIVSTVSSKGRSLLVRTARTLWLIRRLAEGGTVARNVFLSAPLVVPDGIFPLPMGPVDLKNERDAQASSNAAAAANRRQRLAQLATDLSSYRQAADELLEALKRSTTQPAVQPAVGRSRGRPAAAPATTLTAFVLSDAAAQGLSDQTKATLQKIRVDSTQIDVVKALALLDKQATITAGQLYAATGSSNAMVRVGNQIIPQGALAGGSMVIVDPGPIDTRSPGPCPPTLSTTPPGDSGTVPTGHGDARIIGIADLLVVEQELLRYQLGEIAHIENVLKSESRSRRFKTRDTFQQTQTTETETITTKEQDLSSTERFELQTESQTVISDNASKEAGLTIHASYGPSVDATANYNTSNSTSTQQSNSVSTNYAREITNKAVQRVQTRTLTRRTVTTIHVTEEINNHAFDNKSGTSDVVGVYRFVDKVYRAQVVSYGKRLMLEFVVPEPAAFLRYALTQKPTDNVTLVNPDPPGYCLADGTSFVALQATDITRDNYLYWAAKYGAGDVNPPPLNVYIATASKKAPDQMQTVPSGGERKINSDLLDVPIPDGYLCQSAFVNIYGDTQSGAHKIVIQLQEQQSEYVEPWEDNIVYVLDPTPTLTITINSLGFHNYEVLATAFCALTQEKFQDWQLKTFISIMNSYNDLKSAYDQAVREAKLQASDPATSGTNPENNVVIEQTELKKGCISLLTGQRYDLFRAVVRHVAPYGYPEIDFADAKAEGAYISFFEQSFEWSNMVYVFYPYFWGLKDDWVTVVQLSDNDPLFGQFLRAGAARVRVPVRIGFEEGILTYLSTGELWMGEGTLTNSEGGGPDPLQLSIIDELKGQTNDNNVDGVGTLSVTKNSTVVTGTSTAFTADDVNKRIIILGVTHVIKTVQDAQTIELTTPYTGESAQGLAYAIGGKLIGQPWEVKLPTSLVKLDDTLTIS